jgi:hypothetical protein
MWAPGPVWTGAENLAHTGIRSTDRPDLSELLYRLSYRGTPHCSLKFKYSASFFTFKEFFQLTPGTALTTSTSSPVYSHSALDTLLYNRNDDQLNKIQCDSSFLVLGIRNENY